MSETAGKPEAPASWWTSAESWWATVPAVLPSWARGPEISAEDAARAEAEEAAREEEAALEELTPETAAAALKDAEEKAAAAEEVRPSHPALE